MTGSRVAIVTGGSRGIGRAVAERLVQDGVAVVITYVTSSQVAGDIVATVLAAGGQAVAIRADVTDVEQVKVLFDQAESDLGGIDIVVTSAGIMRPALLAEATDDDFTEQVEVNIRGTFNALREAARRVRDGGRIITFSSTTLALNAPGYGIYNATKGAVEGFSRVLAKEAGPRGITVNSVAPGPVETQLFLTGKTAADVQRMAGLAPQQRIGQPVDIAGAVALLVSPEAGWINGQIIRVNGGLA
ncbi:SDR family oxidoreductase [Jatrophihabitans lederbergiae]|uniref:SDR family oxidoreductase n=1 Tax=Jatrophihabitans lederbergiae TaxID=3075547 RepID=A0ABU2JFE5_9ACTN|nr:SDR family oxidoreductase [Jatrophihabitans sp. DSM 44399]MDT0263647.1 SDR family oxidoreductase [Jatrophihabitans sp. DSM 44399]MDT0264153.1 SDR family oxidoreductase [Jatrophihabitans sp. DSM 44399]